MFAIIQTGGKQYRVAEGDILRVELLEKEPKQAVTFEQVLLIDNGRGPEGGPAHREGRQGRRPRSSPTTVPRR